MSKKSTFKVSKEENIRVYFNGKKVGEKSRIFKVILKHLAQAEESIFIGVAWLTNKKIIKKLGKKSKKIKEIKILISDEKSHLMNNGQESVTLGLSELQNTDLYLWKSYRIDLNKVKFHHKFCIIDRKILITGSFNWSGSATYNEENILVIKESKVVDRFIKEFNKLLSNEACKKIEDKSMFIKEMESLMK